MAPAKSGEAPGSRGDQVRDEAALKEKLRGTGLRRRGDKLHASFKFRGDLVQRATPYTIDQIDEAIAWLADYKKDIKGDLERLKSCPEAAVPLHGVLDDWLGEHYGEYPDGDGSKVAHTIFVTWLKTHTAGDLLLHDLNEEKIKGLIRKRQKDTVNRRARDGRIVTQPPATSTVRRSIPQLLRRVVNWHMEELNYSAPETLERIRWKRLISYCGEEHDVETVMSPAQFDLIAEHMRPGYFEVFKFLLIAARRLSEVCNLEWSQVEFDHARRIARCTTTVKSTGVNKKRQSWFVPPAGYDILMAQRSGDVSLHPRFVFTEEAVRSRDGLTKGERYHITTDRMKTYWKRFRIRHGLIGLRLHDLRHTSLSYLSHATGGNRASQHQAGHSNAATTEKYTHAIPEIHAAALGLGTDIMPFGLSERANKNGSGERVKPSEAA